MSKRPEYQLASVAELFKTAEEREEDKLEKVQIVPAEQIHPYPIRWAGRQRIWPS